MTEAHPSLTQDSYARAGVNIAAGNRAVAMMKAAVQSTHGPEVLAGVGAFGGMFDASQLKAMDAPVLVASTDGVGTKTKVAAQLGRWDTIGQDLVNHCVNDILVQGARPLFFMDYVAASRLDAAQIATIVSGMALACRENGCALLGGETAEMPGIYLPGEVDVAGTIVGAVERAQAVTGDAIRPGDVILGLPSTGLHTNGFTLARQALAPLDWSSVRADLAGQTIGQALLAVHRSYLPEVSSLKRGGIAIHGMAHITGGGLAENAARMLPDDVCAHFSRAWSVPPVFTLIQRTFDVSETDMLRTFNMGLGLCVVVPAAQTDTARQIVPDAFVAGHIVTRSGDAVVIQ